MNSWKKTLAVLSVLLLTLGLSSSIAADIEDEQWAPSAEFQKFAPIVDAPHSIVMEEVVQAMNVVSRLYAETYGKSDSEFSRFICTSTSAKNCTNAQDYVFNAVFPTCQSAGEVNCIKDLVARGGDGKALQATFIEYAVKDHFNSFPAEPEYGIPEGVTGSIWSIPGAPHKYGDKYAIFVNAEGVAKGNQKNGWPAAFRTLNARIIPVSVQKTRQRTESWGTYQDNLLNRAYKDNTRGGPFYDNDEGFRCVSPYGQNNNECLIAHAFPENIRFSLQVNLAVAPVGWVHGRMIEPDINIAKASNGYEIAVEASPARIPSIFHVAKWSELPAAVQKYWETAEEDCYMNSCGYRGSNNYGAPMANQTTQIQSINYGKHALQQLKLYLPLVKDTAIASPSTWSWRTLGSNEMASANGCFIIGDGVKGIVTTNASAYSAGPPAFVDGTLNYQVAAPHFNRDGTVFKGDYTLVLDSKVARCLYKFSNAPIQATISVVNDKGEQSVATTTVTEKNGWLRLVARNFEFSAPSIAVKLSQEAAAKADPAPTAAPAAKKSTITCIKGKTLKKVTAVKPTCPKGYKKK